AAEDERQPRKRDRKERARHPPSGERERLEGRIGKARRQRAISGLTLPLPERSREFSAERRLAPRRSMAFERQDEALCGRPARHSHKPSPATVFDYSCALAQGDWCPRPALTCGQAFAT